MRTLPSTITPMARGSVSVSSDGTATKSPLVSFHNNVPDHVKESTVIASAKGGHRNRGATSDVATCCAMASSTMHSRWLLKFRIAAVACADLAVAKSFSMPFLVTAIKLRKVISAHRGGDIVEPHARSSHSKGPWSAFAACASIDPLATFDIDQFIQEEFA